MPLTDEQRTLIKNNLNLLTDTIIKCHHIQAICNCFNFSRPTIEQAKKYLSINYVKKLSEDFTVPDDIKKNWEIFFNELNDANKYNETALNILSKEPNYDPIKIVIMARVTDNIVRMQGFKKYHGLYGFAYAILRLTEAFLGMSQMKFYKYGDNYAQYRKRISTQPFFLDRTLPCPTADDIHNEIRNCLQLKLDLYQIQHSKKVLRRRHSFAHFFEHKKVPMKNSQSQDPLVESQLKVSSADSKTIAMPTPTKNKNCNDSFDQPVGEIAQTLESLVANDDFETASKTNKPKLNS
jgi:hypothetical protein